MWFCVSARYHPSARGEKNFFRTFVLPPSGGVARYVICVVVYVYAYVCMKCENEKKMSLHLLHHLCFGWTLDANFPYFIEFNF